MLIEACIGDAYGGGFEYADESIVRDFGPALQYIAHQKHKQITPGKYTDDTQMALAICEAMLENDPWTPRTLAQRFVDVFKRDERTGYSGAFYGVLSKVANGEELLRTVDGNSERSGGAMRAFPIGLYSQIPEIIIKSAIQASITHCSMLGIQAAIASALMTHYFCYRVGPKSELGLFLNKWTTKHKDIGDWQQPYLGKVNAQGWMSVKAAVTAIIASSTMTELLVKCIAFTGDVDTVACIALAAASFSDEIKQDLPQRLYSGLENGKFGKDYINSLDQQLLKRIVRPVLSISKPVTVPAK